ncbi:hypothetical protein D9Q98_001071 [Chlorella vulgaris]|uniref:PPM-type phosphatase domain-containing protein n=1 Tax=Chlorella vulgaris TaxID=3077 RepID=A0A9D4TZ64_CHLVU|nr:hypothetical protein D9Q98_001071 [Chlorella vulgaris]
MPAPTVRGSADGVRVDPAPAEERSLREAHFVAHSAVKHEDVSIVRTSQSFSCGISLYAVADGHNGSAAARYVSTLLPEELERQLGGKPCPPSDEAVQQALARAFVAVDAAVSSKLCQSGCTLTAAVVSGDVLTVATVGDSKAILDTGAEVVQLTADHRIGENPGEFARLERAGGRLARLNEYGAGPSRGASDGVGPVRLWPGGIMVARAIGDRDVGDILLPSPHIIQVRLPSTGARLIMASDGLWDSMPEGRVARVLRQHGTAKAAATQAVSSVAASRGGFISDDVTVIVVNILPPDTPSFKEVCYKYGGRLRHVLSSPNLVSIPGNSRAVSPEKPRQPVVASRSSSLFSCFSRAVVLDADGPPPQPEGKGIARRSQSFQLNPSTSVVGGSERSMRGGVVRDPSLRGCRRATTVEVLCDTDTANWSPAAFGRCPSLSARQGCSRSSSSSEDRLSPRGIVGGLPYGVSLSSLLSDEEGIQQLSRRNSAAGTKCHGGSAAAAMLVNA